jgi:hypothetical protein
LLLPFNRFAFQELVEILTIDFDTGGIKPKLNRTSCAESNWTMWSALLTTWFSLIEVNNNSFREEDFGPTTRYWRDFCGRSAIPN